MKKIGVLHGMERSFPDAFVERINKMGLKDIKVLLQAEKLTGLKLDSLLVNLTFL